jgi:hypothetical protein
MWGRAAGAALFFTFFGISVSERAGCEPFYAGCVGKMFGARCVSIEEFHQNPHGRVLRHKAVKELLVVSGMRYNGEKILPTGWQCNTFSDDGRCRPRSISVGFIADLHKPENFEVVSDALAEIYEWRSPYYLTRWSTELGLARVYYRDERSLVGFRGKKLFLDSFSRFGRLIPRPISENHQQQCEECDSPVRRVVVPQQLSAGLPPSLWYMGLFPMGAVIWLLGISLIRSDHDYSAPSSVKAVFGLVVMLFGVCVGALPFFL